MQEDIASLKTENLKSDFDHAALLRNLTNQNSAALRVLQEIKEDNSKIKRAFEMEKRLIADNVNFFKEEVKTLDSTLVDFNTTFSSIIPELIVNFDNAKTDFVSILGGTRNDFVSTLNGTRNDFATTLSDTRNDFVSTLNGTRNDFVNTLSGTRNDYVTTLLGTRNDFVITLNSTLQTMEFKLSNISSKFVQLGQDFIETLGSVEENVKIGISTSIKEAFDDKMKALDNSISSKLTNVFETKMNSLKYSIETGYTSALSTKMSDLKSYISSEHTTALSRFSTIDNNLNNIASGVAATRTVANDVYWTTLNLHYFWPDKNKTKTMRLANATRGSNWVDGRLEVFKGKWGTVCDDNFDNDDALAVCKMFTSATHGQKFDSAKYGRGTGPILLDNVECSGSESSIFDCSHRGVGVSDCHHGEDVSIYCRW